MSDEGLQQARGKMEAEGVDPTAIEVFTHYYRLVESGETGMVPEDTIEPVVVSCAAKRNVFNWSSTNAGSSPTASGVVAR